MKATVEFLVVPPFLVNTKVTRGMVVLAEAGDDQTVPQKLSVIKDKRSLAVGSVYAIEVEGTEAGRRTFLMSSAKWVRRSAHPDVDAWEARLKAEALAERSAAVEAKGVAAASLDRHIAPLRAAYHRQLAQHRLPFELWLLQQIRRPL